jgi:hypothetical protein
MCVANFFLICVAFLDGTSTRGFTANSSLRPMTSDVTSLTSEGRWEVRPAVGPSPMLLADGRGVVGAAGRRGGRVCGGPRAVGGAVGKAADGSVFSASGYASGQTSGYGAGPLQWGRVQADNEIRKMMNTMPTMDRTRFKEIAHLPTDQSNYSLLFTLTPRQKKKKDHTKRFSFKWICPHEDYSQWAYVCPLSLASFTPLS